MRARKRRLVVLMLRLVVLIVLLFLGGMALEVLYSWRDSGSRCVHVSKEKTTQKFAVEILVTFETTTGYRHRIMDKTEGYYRELRRKMGDTEEVAEEKLRKVSKPIPVK